MNDYMEKINTSKEVCTFTKLLDVILDAKYKKSDLNKVMKNLCQHLTKAQRNELLKLLLKLEELFNGTLGTWKTDPVDFEQKEDVKPMCSRSFTVLKLCK